ncbi:MAG: type II toxin-antitoxin system VapC family toxin [Bacteroidota bacterium]
MTYLLDTHVLIWSILEPNKLSTKARQIIEDSEQQIMVSAITFWEISLKFGLGKLDLTNVLPEDFPGICVEMNFEIIPLDGHIAASYNQLTKVFHKDPFDRMLIWQAKCMRIPIISKDEAIKEYESDGVSVIW